MTPLDTLASEIKHVDSLLDEEALEPDLDRTDWERMNVRLGMLRDGVDDVVNALDAAIDAAPDAMKALVARRVAGVLGAASATLFVSGDADGASRVRAVVLGLAGESEEHAEVVAGDADPRTHALLVHARWLIVHRRRDRADQLARAVISATKADALRNGAREILHAPRPLQSAPPLFRINGCGVGLYGERDRTEDGWYIATYCVCLLWIPILPLTAYRVRKVDDGYQFVAKERLGPIARAWQAIGVLAALAAIGWGGVSSYLDSPDRKARVAMEDARAAEAKGDRQRALERYGEITKLYGDKQDVSAAAEAILRLTAAAVPDPCTAAAVDDVRRVVDAFDGLPPAPRASVAGSLVKRLNGWADQIGEGSSAQIHAALTVLDMAAEVAERGAPLSDIDARRARLRRVLAGRVAEARPLHALALTAVPPADPEAIALSARIVDGFGAAPSLWLEAEHDISAWADAAEKRTDLEAAAKRARAQITAAHAAHDAGAALIEAGDEKQIAAALGREPQDQELGVALAQIQRRRGDVKTALATLTALGAPGRMTAAAQEMFAACLAESGDLARADTVLSDLLDERLPAFQAAQRAFEGAAERAQAALIARAREGDLDPEVRSRIEAAPEAERAGIFQSWLSQHLAADRSLKALRTEYLRHGEVVPASLALGSIKLRRAAAAGGDARRALLAAAEKVFLSIQRQAEGDPSYHLGLGQVYHRLGRTEEGNTELSRVLDRKDPELTLGVAQIYRDLGLTIRAKQVAEGLYQTTSEDRWKYSAASLMSHLVNETGLHEDEEEMWLKRADPASSYVKQLLLRLEARRLRRQGKLAEADRAFARLIEGYERDAAHDASATSANNAAVSYLERYGASGDPAHLRAAVKHLESAHRLSPQNAMVTGNLADAVGHAATIAVLDRWIKTRSLALDESEASIMLDAVLHGPLRDEALGALRKDPSFHRALDLTQEEQALAPQRQEGYERLIRWLSWSDDEKGLTDLQQRLAGMPAFDASAVAEARASRDDKAKDDLDKAIVAQTVKRAEDLVARLEHGADDRTLSAARLVLGLHRNQLAHLDPTVERADAAVDACRKAAQGWPEGGADDYLSATLAWAALVRAAPESGAVAKIISTDRRDYGTAMLLVRAASGPDGAGALAALQRRPEIAEAARVRKARASKRPEILDAVLARVAGDPELEQAAAGVFNRGSIAAELSISVLLAPGQEAEKYELDWFKRGGKP